MRPTLPGCEYIETSVAAKLVVLRNLTGSHIGTGLNLPGQQDLAGCKWPLTTARIRELLNLIDGYALATTIASDGHQEEREDNGTQK